MATVVESSAGQANEERPAPIQPASPARLESLDVFRGMTIAGMILVNNPGSWSAIYWPLAHADWHGWTPTDLIFPFFLFIAGVAMPLSFDKRMRMGDTRGRLLRHAAQRSALIFLTGLFMAAFPFFDLGTLRIPGVLQRIALCYIFAALIYLCVGQTSRSVRRPSAGASAEALLKAPFRSVHGAAPAGPTETFRGRPFRPNPLAIWGVIAALLLGYWALMMRVPVPGYGPGRLDPEGNLAAYLDRALLLGHLWKPTWDPEGLLSTLPAIATALFGVLLGDWLLRRRGSVDPLASLDPPAASDPVGGSPRAGRKTGPYAPPLLKPATFMFVWGAAGLAAGQLWNLWFPINKNLWTSSYVVFTAGFACIVLGLCYLIMDERGARRWAAPFLWYGMNPLFLFVAAGLFAKMLGIWRITVADPAGAASAAAGSAAASASGQAAVAGAHTIAGAHTMALKTWLYQSFFAPLAWPQNASLLFALAYVALWLAVAWLLHRRKIFIKL